MDNKFRTVLFGYDKEQVDSAFAKMQSDMDILAEESKNKIKQAQTIAMQANALAEELQKEMQKIKWELNHLKNK